MKRLFIAHLLPVEYYPLMINFIEELEYEPDAQVMVFSTHNNMGREVVNSSTVGIKRTENYAFTKQPILKIWRLFLLVLKSFWQAIKTKPDVIMYFEPHSAITAYLYMRLVNPKVRLYIHNYEYYSKNDFLEPNMVSVRWFHYLETSYLYKKATWISQTNAARLKFFHEDYPFVEKDNLKIVPNYPPKKWLKFKNPIKTQIEKLRLLYIGSLSFENTYIREIVDFVNHNKNDVSLTIYGFNVKDDVKTYLENQVDDIVKFHDNGIPYNDIPKIAGQFNVGLILYKAHNINFKYNAPNKLFEYLACNLSVWLPNVMQGCRPYLDATSRPVITAIDFEALDLNSIENFKKSLTLPFAQKVYTSQEALKPLKQHLLAS